MKLPLLFIVAFASCAAAEAVSDRVISSFEVQDTVLWGSVSAQHPSAGFYGQYFSFARPISVKSISVFVYDHPDHAETEASINIGVWAFDKGPTDEIYVSGPQTIQSNEVGNWKTIEIPVELDLEAGEYVIGAGQEHIQGFVAFGNARAISQKGLWLTNAYPRKPDGSSGWKQVLYGPQSEECPTAVDCALMIRVHVADDR